MAASQRPLPFTGSEATFRPGRHGKGRRGEPEATGDLSAEPPDWMSDSQKEAWRYAVEHAPAGVLKAIDCGILTVWVAAEDQHRRATVAQAHLDSGNSFPLLAKSRRGPLAASPYLGIIHRAGLLMVKAASELGFTPACRPRVPAAPSPPPDGSPWDRFSVVAGGKP